MFSIARVSGEILLVRRSYHGHRFGSTVYKNIAKIIKGYAKKMLSNKVYDKERETL